ncbi:interleukin-15-like isoform X2 [Carcharodon carcharias]|uniref:interleukin-15-like isoform X2 n=1 Tax=Carcharodon carcharias TaxID=13397 RepID=UPI001B7E01BA|nr:interleukin-15-like isoform X2 [Carcharodon carcharias]
MNPLFYIFALTLTRLLLMQFALLTQRRQVKRVCFYCYLHLSLDCHIFTFINTETGISLLLFCLALCLPKADATSSDNASKLKELKAELKEILQVVKSMQKQMEEKQNNESLLYTQKGLPELRLYTPERVPRDCFETAFNCFIQELQVLKFELSFDSYKLTHMKILTKNARTFSEFIRPKNCTICEEFQEKKTSDFLKAFETLLQQKYKVL